MKRPRPVTPKEMLATLVATAFAATLVAGPIGHLVGHDAHDHLHVAGGLVRVQRLADPPKPGADHHGHHQHSEAPPSQPAGPEHGDGSVLHLQAQLLEATPALPPRALSLMPVRPAPLLPVQPAPSAPDPHALHAPRPPPARA
ncbi:MAG: hypothetical protein AMXMBFR64_62050 [Myxococcales bacterium]